MEIIKSLINLGLNEKEAKVYLALLQTGTSKAYVVSKYSGLKKPTTYVVLENLVDKGVAQRTPKQKSMYYSPISPEELFDLTKNKIKLAESSLPELKALNKNNLKKQVNVSYYEGLGGIREMYNKLEKEMVGKEYVGFFAHAKNTPKELQGLFDEINEEYLKKRIKRRVISTEDKSLKKYFDKEFMKKNELKLKTLPIDVYDSNVSIEIFKNYTQIFSHRYLQGVVIDNPDIAKTMKQIFEVVWKNIKNK